MDIITDCENRLGWAGPAGSAAWKVRAGMHRRMTLAMERREYTEKDLRLALNYCITRRHPITTPMDLFGLVLTAREYASDVPSPDTTGEDITGAVAHEQDRADEDSLYWINRLVRAVGPLRSEVFAEWKGAGRGA